MGVDGESSSYKQGTLRFNASVEGGLIDLFCFILLVSGFLPSVKVVEERKRGKFSLSKEK